MHDTDGNNKLDGCELVKSLIHWHGREEFIFYRCFGTQCCWSGMFIPDPGSKDLGSRVKKISDPDPQQRVFNPKIVSKLSEIWSGMFIPNPDLGSGSWFFTHHESDPWVKKAADPGSGSATLLEPHRCHRGPQSLRKLKIRTFTWMYFFIVDPCFRSL